MKSSHTCQDWFQTFSGICFNPCRAIGNDIDICDIAHALSNYCRFGGHTVHFYSVAQHSCLVHDHLPEGVLRAQGLLHDATESYLGDVVKPLKMVLRDYQKIERRLERIIMRRFNLPLKLKPQVKAVDLTALATEKRDLINYGPIWKYIEGVTPWPETITPWPPAVAKAQFFKRFYALELE